jgi:hypothetical protein
MGRILHLDAVGPEIALRVRFEDVQAQLFPRWGGFHFRQQNASCQERHAVQILVIMGLEAETAPQVSQEIHALVDGH